MCGLLEELDQLYISFWWLMIFRHSFKIRRNSTLKIYQWIDDMVYKSGTTLTQNLLLNNNKIFDLTFSKFILLYWIKKLNDINIDFSKCKLSYESSLKLLELPLPYYSTMLISLIIIPIVLFIYGFKITRSKISFLEISLKNLKKLAIF